MQVGLVSFQGGDFRRILASDVSAKEAYDRMRREIRALPGVIEVGLGSTMPLRSTDLRFDVKAEGKSLPVGEPLPRADFRTASPEYFRASGIPILRGRAFAATDEPRAAKVVIINQALADKYFPNEDPVGKRIAWAGDVLKYTPFSGEWRTIVGVVGNTLDGGPDAKPRAAVFMPFAQELALFAGIVIRADSNALGLVPDARRIVQQIAPRVPIENVMTVRQFKDRSILPRRLNATLVSAFGVLAVIIAAVGIAGVLAFSVSARTNEIGIRMSLGANRGQVERMILTEGGILLATGLALGVTGAFFAVGIMRGLLFGVAPHDPVTFVGVAAIMAVVGLIACWIPALRASRIDPAIAMRA
jgi:putative ABC transport system permease protein